MLTSALHNFVLRKLAAGIKHGSLALRLPNAGAERHILGTGAPHAEWTIHSNRALRRLVIDPELALGETYMAGEWEVTQGKLLALMEVLLRNFPERDVRGWRRVVLALPKALQQGNRIARSYRNVAHHYDLDEQLFRAFLDRDMHYSCAYFERPDMVLDEAQQAKCRLIMKKLLLQPGHSVLDIGSGWGGLALYLAQYADVRVTGLTLSKEQLRVAQRRAAERDLQNRVSFVLQDYREHRGAYDRIVSVGMFEHVGQPNYRSFFQQLAGLLKPDGIALLHTIGRMTPPHLTNPWIRQYIFPGGYIPALSEVSRGIEAARLCLGDIEILRLHYALTLAAWQQRFQAVRAEVGERLGEQFCRMWEFYLAISEAAFRWHNMAVFQLQLSRDIRSVPPTRDYLYAAVPLSGVRGSHPAGPSP